MSRIIDRRNFIKTVSFSTISIALSNPFEKPFAANRYKEVIENQFFKIEFNTDSGRFSIFRSDGSILLKNATLRANVANIKRSLDIPSFKHSAQYSDEIDNLFNGKRLVIFSRDLQKQLNFKTVFTLNSKNPEIIIEQICTNVSNQDIIIRSLEPVCAIKEINSSLYWLDAQKVITNGPMYYDAGIIQDFSDPFFEADPYGPTKGGKLSTDFLYPDPTRVRSWWNIGLFKGYDKESLVCGFVDNQNGLGQIVVSKNNDGSLSLFTESVFATGTILKAGDSISSNKFLITLGENPFTALEGYAELMGKLNQIKPNSIINGWCNWFFTYQYITEDEVIRNAEFASKHLKQYGFEYIQIDEGYQRYHGDWDGNERFPGGMKWLADKIKSFGLKPGIWIAPYIISEPTEVFQNHKDWMLKNSDGSLMRVGPWPSLETDWAKNENPKRYCLDITHPEAQKWFYNLFDKAANEWGYEMFKIDFVAWSILSAHHYFDKSYTPARAYRKGLEIMRSAIGNEKHINDCGPGPVSVGLIDSMRIEIDQYYGFREAAWKQYFTDSSSSAPAMAKRYYFNNRTWINDADHICINLLSLKQAEAAATLIGLSGGNIISGDRLTDLDEYRLEILKKIYPSYGVAAKPLDLFDSDRHSIFSVKIKKSFNEWMVLALFNANQQKSITHNLYFDRLELDREKTYLVYDFWLEKYLGEINHELNLTVLPESVTLLSIHEKKEFPFVISTNRHILQGALELETVNWDEENKILSGVSLSPKNSNHVISIYIPQPQYWEQSEKSLYKDFNHFTTKLVNEHILNLKLRFENTEKIEWSVDFNSIFN